MGRILLSALVLFSAVAAYGQNKAPANASAPTPALVTQYCVGCHNEKTHSGNLVMANLDFVHVEKNASELEMVVRKLEAGMMPPAAMPRPDAAATKAFLTSLEGSLDKAAAANPNPGRKPIHRLNRAEYANSVRDILGLEVDASELLPPDSSTQGFDNMAEVLNVSTTLMDAYVRAASKVARMAVGDTEMAASTVSFTLAQGVPQMKHVDGAPMGTRGGTVVRYFFPLDGDYVFRMNLYHLSTGPLFGQGTPGEQIEVAIDGERVALLNVNPNEKESDRMSSPSVKVTAGYHMVSAAFIQRFAGTVQDFHTPWEYTQTDQTHGSILGYTALPHLKTLSIVGPQNVQGAGETATRKKIFICKPASSNDEAACAKKIISNLARMAFRRPSTDADITMLMTFFEEGRKEQDFDSGVRMVVQRVLADPEFIFRLERRPTNVAAGQNYRIPDFELASRLSYFLWSSAPDDQLLSLAAQNKLKDPVVVEQQVKRMLLDPRAESLAANFAGQWLFLRNLKDVQPDNYLFLNFEYYLKDSMQRETELLFDSIVREDHDVLDLLNADYTFVNERLALHYGIPNVKGERFRRVQITDPNRRGLLGQASILTLTSLSNRTSPVQRGKWVMENILGVHPPPPPPNVPQLKEVENGGKRISVRERLEQHRANAFCATCHKMMDPIGFALDNFDAVGIWRIKDNGFPIDASGQLVDSTKLDGPVSLREALVARSDVFYKTFAEKLLTYALGRRIESYDMPAIRSIVREAARSNHHFSAFVVGIAKSVPFQMRKAEDETSTAAAKH